MSSRQDLVVADIIPDDDRETQDYETLSAHLNFFFSQAIRASFLALSVLLRYTGQILRRPPTHD